MTSQNSGVSIRSGSSSVSSTSALESGDPGSIPTAGWFLLLFKNPYSAKKLSKWRPKYVTFKVAYFSNINKITFAERMSFKIPKNFSSFYANNFEYKMTYQLIITWSAKFESLWATFSSSFFNCSSKLLLFFFWVDNFSSRVTVFSNNWSFCLFKAATWCKDSSRSLTAWLIRPTKDKEEKT